MTRMERKAPPQENIDYLHGVRCWVLWDELNSRKRGGRGSWEMRHFSNRDILKECNRRRKIARAANRNYWRDLAISNPDQPYWRKPSTRYKRPPPTWNQWQVIWAKKEETNRQRAREAAWLQLVEKFESGAIPRSSAQGRAVEQWLKQQQRPNAPLDVSPTMGS